MAHAVAGFTKATRSSGKWEIGCAKTFSLNPALEKPGKNRTWEQADGTPWWPGNPNLEIMAILIDHGADVNLQTERSDRTPLMLAAAFGFREAVELLLAHGADPTIRTGWGSRSAADWARLAPELTPQPEMAKYLEEKASNESK